jgi:hypothetical protein
MKYVISVFYLEIAANLFLIGQCLFFPAAFVAGFSPQTGLAGGAGSGALRMRGPILRLVLEVDTWLWGGCILCPVRGRMSVVYGQASEGVSACAGARQPIRGSDIDRTSTRHRPFIHGPLIGWCPSITSPYPA